MAKDRLKRLEMNGTKFRCVRFIGGRSVRIPLHTGDLHEALTRRDALDRDFDHKAPSQDWAHKLAAVAQRERREEIFELIAGGATERAIAVERHTPHAARQHPGLPAAFFLECLDEISMRSQAWRTRGRRVSDERTIYVGAMHTGGGLDCTSIQRGCHRISPVARRK